MGNTSVASDTIRVYLGVVPGESYNPDQIQKNFLNLWQTGLFDDIRIEADRGENGVIVKAFVKERPRIGSVEFRGNKDLNTAKINEGLEKEKIDLHVGNTIEQTLVRRAAEAIKHAYSENGYEGVTVDTTTEDMTEPGEKKIVFIINEGIKATVATIDFTGNNHFSSRRLRTQMKEVKPNGLISWIRKKNLYIPSKLDEDLENIKNYYQDYGYQNVSFGDPIISTVRTGKKPRVKITIPIKEGVVHTFGDVSVSGNTVFTKEQIIGGWPLRKGETIRRKPIQTRIDAFSDAYRSRGYIYSYVNPEYVEKENNVVDVNIQVYEGDQFRLGRLEFTGNTTTKDKVLRREIFLEEGEIMDMETFKQSLYKLGQLGYFKVTDNPDFKVNQDKKTVDITVKGNEEGKNDVQFGGGYSAGHRVLRADAVLDAQLPRRRREPRPEFSAGKPAELLLAFLRRPLVHGHAEQSRRLDFQPHDQFPSVIRIRRAQQRRVDRLWLSTSSLRQPFARLWPRARSQPLRVQHRPRCERQRPPSRYLRLHVYAVVDRTVVRV